VPDRLTVCGLPLALSAMLSEAASVPTTEGVNITAIVQLAPAASGLPHVLDSSKSLALVPVNVKLAILKAALPVLLKMTLCAALVVSAGSSNARLVDDRLTTGPPTVKFSGLEAPPPGAGFVTTTG
jgi:hypothetical protein